VRERSHRSLDIKSFQNTGSSKKKIPFHLGTKLNSSSLPSCEVGNR
jgi:hypothetical protein